MEAQTTAVKLAEAATPAQRRVVQERIKHAWIGADGSGNPFAKDMEERINTLVDALDGDFKQLLGLPPELTQVVVSGFTDLGVSA